MSFKNIIASLLLATCGLASAGENVTIAYGFGPADTEAQTVRALIAEANKLQDKYTFSLDIKPGAGNSIAANYALKTPNTMLATSSAFFVRPNIFPNESYPIAEFKEILPLAEDPIAVASSKYKSWKEVPTDVQITVGVSGLGVTTHVIAVQLATKYPKVKVVPYKSTTEANLALVSGQLDIQIGFLGEELPWVTNADTTKRVNILGLTGDKTVNGYPTLVSQGFPKSLAQMNIPEHIVVATTTPADKFTEWRSILFKAATAQSVQETFHQNFAMPMNSMSDSNIQPWYAKQTEHWKQMSSVVKMDQ